MKTDALHIKRKQEEVERALAIFFPRCTRRHPRNEFPLNSIRVCSVCEEDHSIDKRPSLLGLKAIFQGAAGVTENIYYINQRGPHGPRSYQQGMQGTSQAYYNPNQVTSIPSWGAPYSSFLVLTSSLVLHISISCPTSHPFISILCSAATSVQCSSSGVEAQIPLSSRPSTSTTYPTTTPSTSISNIHSHSTTCTTTSKPTH